MGQFTISLMGLIDSYSLNNQSNLNKTTTQYRIDKGREILLPKSVVSGEFADEFLDRFIRLFIIQNLYENIIYDTCERWLLRFQLECELKLPLYYAKYSAMKNLKLDEITEISKSVARANSKTSGQSNSEGKSLSSTFPEHIANKEKFDDVTYMDNGSRTQDSSKNSATSDNTSEAVVYSNLLDRIEQFKASQTDLISECVAEFDNLFLGVY